MNLTGGFQSMTLRYSACAGLLATVLISAGCSTAKTVEKPKPDRLGDIQVLADPSVMWTASAGKGSDRSVVRFTPYVTDDAVYAINAKGRISAISRGTGSVLWESGLNARPTAGIGGDDQYLYAGTGDGRVFSISQADGSVAWTTVVSSEIIAPPTAGLDFVVVRSIDGRVYALNKNNGARRWIYTYNVPALSLHGNGRPVVVPDGVLVGLDNGRLAALRSTDGRVFWEARLSDGSGRSEIDRLNDLDADLSLDDDYIYAVNYQGAVAQIDPGSGNRLWSAPMSSAVGLDVSNSTVVVTDEFDTVWGLRSDDGTVLWKQENLSNRQVTAPVLTDDGNVVVGDFQGYIHVLSGTTGEMIGRIKAVSGEITNKPILVDNMLYVLSRSGKIAAVRL
jgi:outer membrane protein assembly factor BamB